MEQLLKCTQPALIVASDRLIDLVDQVIQRHPRKPTANSRRKLFCWRPLGLVRPSLDRRRRKSKPFPSELCLIRLEDRIKELCTKATATSESPELNEIFQQLKAALSEHTQRTRKRLAELSNRAERTTIYR